MQSSQEVQSLVKQIQENTSRAIAELHAKIDVKHTELLSRAEQAIQAFRANTEHQEKSKKQLIKRIDTVVNQGGAWKESLDREIESLLNDKSRFKQEIEVALSDMHLEFDEKLLRERHLCDEHQRSTAQTLSEMAQKLRSTHDETGLNRTAISEIRREMLTVQGQLMQLNTVEQNLQVLEAQMLSLEPHVGLIEERLAAVEPLSGRLTEALGQLEALTVRIERLEALPGQVNGHTGQLENISNTCEQLSRKQGKLEESLKQVNAQTNFHRELFERLENTNVLNS